MPSEKINMHGKIYDLYDKIGRNQVEALKEADLIRSKGQVAFLNPQKRKDKETNYWIYVADKSIRRVSSGSRKNISAKVLLTEYQKGAESFGKFMKALEQAQTVVKKELAINEALKETKEALGELKESFEKVKTITPKKNGKKSNGKKTTKK